MAALGAVRQKSSACSILRNNPTPAKLKATAEMQADTSPSPMFPFLPESGIQKKVQAKIGKHGIREIVDPN